MNYIFNRDGNAKSPKNPFKYSENLLVISYTPVTLDKYYNSIKRRACQREELEGNNIPSFSGTF